VKKTRQNKTLVPVQWRELNDEIRSAVGRRAAGDLDPASLGRRVFQDLVHELHRSGSRRCHVGKIDALIIEQQILIADMKKVAGHGGAFERATPDGLAGQGKFHPSRFQRK
jgi:hypothetical protein